MNVKEIRVFYPSRRFKDFFVGDATKFDWKRKWINRVLDNIPDTISQNTIPSRPYAINDNTNFPYYEFSESSKECTDPYERQPDLYMREMDANDSLNYFEAGVRFERIKTSSTFNKIVLILLVVGIIFQVGIMYTNNELKESMAKSNGTIIDLLTKLSEQKAAAEPSGNVAGQVK